MKKQDVVEYGSDMPQDILLFYLGCVVKLHHHVHTAASVVQSKKIEASSILPVENIGICFEYLQK
ncbi:MAG: hypothetical protein IJA10_12320 [Lachnospiraceae bacterium]|nr:hypothetical protein [Lachnospiraceae bacterium]